MKTIQQLAIQHKSDKHNHHDYVRHYDKHFASIRNSKNVILELGIGGYEYSDRGGSGLHLWSDYFAHSKIYGIDFYDKSGIVLPARTKVFKGSQADGEFLTTVLQEIGIPDVIIDDASHMNGLTIESFRHLFPWLRPGGIYVIEDIESSWWNEHGFDGESDYTNNAAETTFNFCKKLLLEVNAKHVPNFKKRYEIDSIHFYQNMVVIVKK